MARINSVKKARKDQGNCIRCGKEIKAGDAYKWTQRRYGPRLVACSEHSFRESEMTGAKYAAALEGREIAEDNIDTFDSRDISDVQTWLDEAGQAAKDVAEEYRESADAQRDSFPESEQADSWDEYADELDCWADSLEDLESTVDAWPEWKEAQGDDADEDDWRVDVQEEARAKLDEFPYPSF